jgi:hypothetical protein
MSTCKTAKPRHHLDRNLGEEQQVVGKGQCVMEKLGHSLQVGAKFD